QKFCIASFVLHAHGESEIFRNDFSPWHKSTLLFRSEDARVRLCCARNHAAVYAVLFRQRNSLVSVLDVSVHKAGNSVFSAHLTNSPQLLPDCPFPGPHGRCPAVDCKPCDSCFTEPPDEVFCHL